MIPDNGTNPEVPILLTTRLMIPDASQFNGIASTIVWYGAATIVICDVVVIAKDFGSLLVDICDLVVDFTLSVCKRVFWMQCVAYRIVLTYKLISVLNCCDSEFLLSPHVYIERIDLSSGAGIWRSTCSRN